MSLVALARARTNTKKPKADLAPGFLVQLRGLGVQAPVRELTFAASIGRKWRFDYAWPELKLALEVEGGAFLPGGSRHTRGAGYREDRIKYGTAFAMGWAVLSVMPEQIKSGQAAAWLAERLRGIKPAAKAERTCEWAEDDESNWITSCGHPASIRVIGSFCSWCGGKITEREG